MPSAAVVAGPPPGQANLRMRVVRVVPRPGTEGALERLLGAGNSDGRGVAASVSTSSIEALTAALAASGANVRVLTGASALSDGNRIQLKISEARGYPVGRWFLDAAGRAERNLVYDARAAPLGVTLAAGPGDGTSMGIDLSPANAGDALQTQVPLAWKIPVGPGGTAILFGRRTARPPGNAAAFDVIMLSATVPPP